MTLSSPKQNEVSLIGSIQYMGIGTVPINYAKICRPGPAY